jgi:hypothetical protein
VGGLSRGQQVAGAELPERRPPAPGGNRMGLNEVLERQETNP